jgi:hypothetical protein
MELEVLKKMAENKNTIFFPVDMLGSVAGQSALNLRVLQERAAQ